MEYDLWTCMYAPSKAADGKLATAWSEGALALEDRFGWQTIRPAWKWPSRSYERYLVAFEILSVYPGTRFDDTLISEVSN